MHNGAFTRTNGANPDSAKTWPQFFTDTVLDEAASAREGRAIYREEERVKIIMPGNALHIPVFKVNQDHIDRWPEQYKAFKENREPALDGTPLEEWPVLNRAQIAELKHLNIRTIEQMAEVSDAVSQRLGMGGRMLKQAAQAYLDDTVRLALTQSQAALIQKLETANGELSAKVDGLGELVTRLHAELQGMRDAPSPLATMIPGMSDPVGLAAQAAAQAPAATSSLDAFAKRRGKKAPAQQDA